jgi:hypothetical protein
MTANCRRSFLFRRAYTILRVFNSRSLPHLWGDRKTA